MEPGAGHDPGHAEIGQRKPAAQRDRARAHPLLQRATALRHCRFPSTVRATLPREAATGNLALACVYVLVQPLGFTDEMMRYSMVLVTFLAARSSRSDQYRQDVNQSRPVAPAKSVVPAV
jgi:hypothetical protein